jgi:hypothetical protein
MVSSIYCRKIKAVISGVAGLLLISVLIDFQSLWGATLTGAITEKMTSNVKTKMVASDPNPDGIFTHRMNQSLPTFENGGILVFYHIYKTGGSTVGKMMHELAQANARTTYFTMVRKTVDWEDHCELYLNIAVTQRKLVMLELHVEFPAPDFPSLVEMAPTLDRWRLEAHRRNIDFFAFTIIREPKAHAISFFNFFHVGAGRQTEIKSWNPFRPLAATEKNFIHAFVGNRQCQMLGSDPESTLSAPRDVVWSEPDASGFSTDQHTCQIDKVYRVLFQSMDWVGTTEKLQNETLPLLTRLILNNPDVGKKVVPFKVYSNSPNQGQGVYLHDLSTKSLSMLERETSLDRRLYEEVCRNFTLLDMGLDENFSTHSLG